VLHTTTHLLVSLHKAHRAALAPRLAELGLNAGDELTLAQLWREEGITQTDLAERLAVRPPTVSKVLRTLERAELVQRLPDAEDGRVSRVHLTDPGRRLRPDVERAWRAAERDTLARLSSSQAAQLRRLLTAALPRPSKRG
jgi:DNA-binding MarR family transcriptional regulator